MRGSASGARPRESGPSQGSYRWVERQEELERSNQQHEVRSLDYYYVDDGSLVIKVRLPAEQGALVLKAIDEAVDASSRKPSLSCK